MALFRKNNPSPKLFAALETKRQQGKLVTELEKCFVKNKIAATCIHSIAPAQKNTNIVALMKLMDIGAILTDKAWGKQLEKICKSYMFTSPQLPADCFFKTKQSLLGVNSVLLAQHHYKLNSKSKLSLSKRANALTSLFSSLS